ncbi:hypothetical protein GCM10010259_45780 [Streptomyces daghestanicus]|uniref:Uncharacterized protein n=1 Tax=Streptomyces daghestanicus TaxID=66885 RepID=A0ABQ3PV53_9ACTN|nr:hypothetical protein GCM10010240_46710 [Streptomyces griseoviridis]GGU49479.1 hypothetical protein GCM10010259_45780 [Streptomyces daghestanicus]GHI28895.1 hypothetical protein Sdagh_06250 [Streptomyces daghestanicus]
MCAVGRLSAPGSGVRAGVRGPDGAPVSEGPVGAAGRAPVVSRGGRPGTPPIPVSY